jgi:hypothetical protein
MQFKREEERFAGLEFKMGSMGEWLELSRAGFRNCLMKCRKPGAMLHASCFMLHASCLEQTAILSEWRIHFDSVVKTKTEGNRGGLFT